MRKLFKNMMVASLFLAATVFVSHPDVTMANSNPKNQWVGNQYYKADGKMAKNCFLKIGKDTYHFDKYGNKERNRLVKSPKSAYYFDVDGKMVKNKAVRVDGIQHWFKSDGKMAKSETVKGKGTRVYFNSKGEVVLVNGPKSRWKPVGRGMYQFDNGLYLMEWTRFRWKDNRTYMVGNNGYQVQGAIMSGNDGYYFDDKDGHMRTGWAELPGPVIGFVWGEGWKYGPSTWRYYDLKTGKMRRGWLTLDGKKYYLNPEDGNRANGRTVIGKKAYLFGKDGVLKKGRFTWKGRHYVADGKTGVLKSGWMNRNGKKYYYRPDNNASAKGTTKIGSSKYFFRSDGSLQYGWVRFGNVTRFADTKTGKIRTGWMTIGGKRYYFRSKDGNMVKGRLKYDGKTWFMDYKTGQLLTKKEDIRRSEEWEKARKAAEAKRKAEEKRRAEAAERARKEPKRFGMRILKAAEAQIGTDQSCTSLVTNALKAVGIFYYGWPTGYKDLGRIVPMKDAIPGDLVYYDDAGMKVPHIAVYAGNGEAIHGGWLGKSTVRESVLPQFNPQFIRVKPQ